MCAEHLDCSILIWGALRSVGGWMGPLALTREILWMPIDQRAGRDLTRMACQFTSLHMRTCPNIDYS